MRAHTLSQVAAFAACAGVAVQAAVVIRPLDAASSSLKNTSPTGSRPCNSKPVWKCAALDLDEFTLDPQRSNVLDGVLVCAYPTREFDERVSPYCTYDLTTGELVGDYNAGFCPSAAVQTRKPF